MQTCITRDFGDGNIAKVGQTRDHSNWLVLGDVRGKPFFVSSVQIEWDDVVQAMCVGDVTQPRNLAASPAQDNGGKDRRCFGPTRVAD